MFCYWRFILALSLLLLPQAALGKTKIVILGDSLTEGFGVGREKAFPFLVEKLLKEAGKDVEVINGGVSGSTAASAPSRMQWYLKANPQVVVLALGANDALRGFKLAGTEKNLSQAIEAAEKKKVKVVLAGMKAPPNYGKSYGDELETLYQRLVRKHKVKLIPFLLEGVAGEAQKNLTDGIHPNEAGHAIIARNVSQFLVPLL